jgi:uncharacterized protein
MPLFHFIGLDKPDGLQTRLHTRPEHLEYARPHTRLGGALLDADGNPQGSVMIIEAESLEAAKVLMDNDPYAKAGVFQHTEIRPWRIAIGGIVDYAG